MCSIAVVGAASFFFCSLREPQGTKEKDIAEDATKRVGKDIYVLQKKSQSK